MKITANTFLVTGGASGLGEASVRKLHAEGATVVIADLNEEQGEALVAELGERALFKSTDVTNESEAQASIAAAVNQFGSF